MIRTYPAVLQPGARRCQKSAKALQRLAGTLRGRPGETGNSTKGACVPDLVPFSMNGNRELKATGRDLAQVARGRAVGLAVIEQQADLNAARVDAVAYVGVRAMHRAAHVVEVASQ